VIDDQGVVLGGNMRLEALKSLGHKEIPDDWVKKASDLTPEQKQEFIIKDNNSFGEYDWDVLANSWSDLPLSEWGVDIPEDWAPVEKLEEDESAVGEMIDRAAELQDKWKVKRGQVWEIGRHRLMCGDSTTDLERLMGGTKADIGMHDPPYGINAPTMTLGAGKKEFTRVDFDKAAPNIQHLLALSSLCAVWGGNYFAHQLPESNDWLCWHKKNDERSYSEFELAWTNFGLNSRHLSHHWSGEIKNHPTQKPEPVIRWALSLVEGESVVDCYAGSGTTLVSCEHLKRSGYGMELSPEYCAVTLERLSALGLKPKLAD